MDAFIPWNSQSMDEWRARYAQGDFIDLDGKSTHYVKKGAGEPVILVHGFFMDLHTWMHNIDALAEHYQVFAFDLWGLGYSSRSSLDYGYDLYVSQLLSFMDVLGIQKAALIGHSLGGGTIIKFSVDYPQRVSKLVLVDAAGIPNRLPLRAKLFNLPGVGEFLMGLNSNFFRRMNLQDLWFFDNSRLTETVFEELTRFQKIEGSTKALMGLLRPEFFHTLGSEIKQLGSMDLPVLVVWGRNETNIPLEVGMKLHQILKGSSMQIIDHAGHMPNFEQPEIFNEIVLNFL
jgi:pimeloyl-ACP methyl ester carboxylesterase